VATEQEGAGGPPADATSARVVYACPACGGSSAAIVTGLSPPAELVPTQTRETLARTEALLEASGRARQRPIDEAVLEAQAGVHLLYATCPRCGARNPEGLAAQANERRFGRLGVLVLCGGIALGAWYRPLVALVAPGLSLVMRAVGLVVARRQGTPPRWPVLAAALAFDAALVALVFAAPRFAFAMPLALATWSMLKSWRVGDEERWRDAAGQIRFELGP
jgi:hypothetical protein